MPILVKIPQDDAPGDWAIIELQGDLQSRTLTDMAGQFIGDLLYTKEGAPILIIGHHILHGKEMKLTKPYAILEKHRNNKPCVSWESGNNSSQPESTTAEIEYLVKAIVTKKLIFKTRPKPIILDTSDTVGKV